MRSLKMANLHLDFLNVKCRGPLLPRKECPSCKLVDPKFLRIRIQLFILIVELKVSEPGYLAGAGYDLHKLVHVLERI